MEEEEEEVKGGGFNLRTSSRQRRCSGVFVRFEGRDDQPVIPSQRASLSSRPRLDNRAYINDEMDWP